MVATRDESLWVGRLEVPEVKETYSVHALTTIGSWGMGWTIELLREPKAAGVNPIQMASLQMNGNPAGFTMWGHDNGHDIAVSISCSMRGAK